MVAPRAVVIDDGLGRFGPMTALRAVFEIRTGIDTTLRRIERFSPAGVAALAVPPELRAMIAARASVPVNALPPGAAEVLLLNGRLLLPGTLPLPARGEAIIDADGAIVAARLERADAARLVDALAARGSVDASALPERMPREVLAASPLVRRPWDVLCQIPQTIAHDVIAGRPDHAIEAAPAEVIGDAIVSVEAGAQICPGVVIDAGAGPVAILAGAVIRPHATLCGPCAIGPGAVVAEQAVIRGATIIGPRCKVGGEVSATIFQGFANKAHDGFFGDSYVGKWVNIGAGSITSNLLNTYGDVPMRLGRELPRERSGRTFLGALIGDHAKLAIGTRIMTGSAIGIGAMIATTAPPPTWVPPFAWLVDGDDRPARRWRRDRFEETLRTVMARRGVEPERAYIEAIRAAYDREAGAEAGPAAAPET
ncbi:MAG TPA: putative sugar nucleotidyl transferase [Phycisphaerales bacterium]|nr:putative sugar nucleotidyl transferase [Phycisphaerales bacterium]HMP37764.1 putative sugar nucleotidyl transferase [Phycisphaerales bacterium]